MCKTTLAVDLACELACTYSVHLVDADPQASAAEWFRSRWSLRFTSGPRSWKIAVAPVLTTTERIPLRFFPPVRTLAT